VLRHPGTTNNLEPAALSLYRDRLPTSGEEARDLLHDCQLGSRSLRGCRRMRSSWNCSCRWN